ncbi:MAG: hypothetical protein NTW96_02995 [Planctomycetia bacterium]|nr:hypothetical protein [Planctomycetia bacterium]
MRLNNRFEDVESGSPSLEIRETVSLPRNADDSPKSSSHMEG